MNNVNKSLHAVTDDVSRLFVFRTTCSGWDYLTRSPASSISITAMPLVSMWQMTEHQ